MQKKKKKKKSDFFIFFRSTFTGSDKMQFIVMNSFNSNIKFNFPILNYI